MSLLVSTIAASTAIAFPDLGLKPTVFEIGWFQLRWYSIAYLAGIFIGYWYLLKLLISPARRWPAVMQTTWSSMRRSGSFLAAAWAYVLFYNLPFYLQHPIDILKLWDGGMSFHGGVIGTSLGILYLARKEKLPWLRITTHVAPAACRLDFLRPPRQLREPGIVGRGDQRALGGPVCRSDGLWTRTRPSAPPQPAVKRAGGHRAVRDPLVHVLADQGAVRARQAGRCIHPILWPVSLRHRVHPRDRIPSLRPLPGHRPPYMGQWLTVPMILGGIYLMATAKKRRERIEPTAGTASVA
jgi:phosphatidylglycerol:prolipoprotein diacylglycerol transferase